MVRVAAEGVPKFGVVKTGFVANTANPVPVSSDNTPANSAEVVAANCANVPPVVDKVPVVGNVISVIPVVVKVNE